MRLKKLLGIVGLGLSLALIVTGCSKNSSGKKEVTFATVGTTKPFSYQNDKGKLTGFDVEVAWEIFKGSKDYKLKIQQIDGDTIYSGLDSAKFDFVGNNLSYTKERGKKYLYSYPTASTPSVLVVPKDSDIKSYDDIGGHTTPVVQGTTGASQLEDYNKKHSDNPTKLKYTEENITQMLSGLNDGKYDFKIFDAPSVNSIIKSQGLMMLLTIDLKSSEKPYIYYLFTSDNKDLQTFVNKRIKALQKDGTLDKLSKEFLGGDYAPSSKDLVVPNKK